MSRQLLYTHFGSRFLSCINCGESYLFYSFGRSAGFIELDVSHSIYLSQFLLVLDRYITRFSIERMKANRCHSCVVQPSFSYWIGMCSSGRQRITIRPVTEEKWEYVYRKHPNAIHKSIKCIPVGRCWVASWLWPLQVGNLSHRTPSSVSALHFLRQLVPTAPPQGKLHRTAESWELPVAPTGTSVDASVPFPLPSVGSSRR